jgi:cytoskeleton protein RodZ
MERDVSPGRAVGRLLRDQRLSRDLSIDDVAARLRIRSRYLEAIEQGRFDQLPGPAYIPAFLRAYANHLGLEADKVMTAYQLSGPVPIERPVALPADFPIIEKRAPIGLAMLTVLLVIGAGYAAWQYMPRQEAIVSQKVPPVPDRLLASPAPATTPATAQPAAPATDQAATTPAVAPPVQEVRLPPPAPPPPPVSDMWPAPKQETAASQPAPPPVTMPMPSPGQAQAAQVPAPPPAAPAAPVVQSPAPQEATAVQPPAAPPAIQPMQSDTRVHVRTNSWIELRGPAGDVLTQTYVRAGESYTVPAGIAYRIIDAR